jgi:linoleoyl-CoA desaturase
MNKYHFEKGSSPFFQAVKQRVDQYFVEHNLHPDGDRKLLTKGCIQILCSCAIYIILVFFTPPPIISVVLCVLQGINLAVIGFNVMHEGGHQTFSRYNWLNSASALSLNALGGNAYYWKVKHNINHHTYTNIEGMDSDIDVKPFMRLHHDQPWRWYHRFQHIYWFLLYAISYLAWIFYEDFKKYFTGKISINGEKKRLPLKEHFIFWFTKLLYVLLYMLIPIFFVGWSAWLVGFLIITMICGLITSVVFQLAHVVEGTHFHSMKATNADKHEWAIHQMVSTSNFGTRSRALHWLLGGLNFQVEHHLFPRISHIHYPAVNHYVKEACLEYNVVYNEHTSMLKAVVSHLVHLRNMGTPELLR